MKGIKFFPLIAVAALATSCITVHIDSNMLPWGRTKVVRANRNIVSRTLENPAPFDEINISGMADVEYTQSSDSTTSVEIYAPDNVIDLLEVAIEEGRLSVGTKTGHSIIGSDVRVRATSPSLRGIGVSGASDISVEGVLTADEFAVGVSGAGDVEIDELICNRLGIGITGAGDVDISRGEAVMAKFTVTGAADINAENLKAKHVEAKVTGAGDIECHATESLSASVSGVGSITYYGNPKTLSTHTSGVAANIKAK
jgi:hypothetical protein